MRLNKPLIIILLSISFFVIQCNPAQETITISGAFGLYPMAIKWAEEFKKIHPEIRLDISAGGAGKGMTDVLYENVDLGMLSRDINHREIEKGAYPVAVVKDAVIPTFNSANPVAKNILSQGLTKKEFTEIFIEEKYQYWGQVLKIQDVTPLHVYTRSDAAGAPETWAKYLNKKQEDLKGVGVFGDPGLAQAVKNDIYSVGFNNVVYVYNSATQVPHQGLSVVPIDINENGKIDSTENFYTTLPAIIKAIGQGKYPSPPARELYLVTKGKPQRASVKEFLRWILTDGQAYVNESGYIQMTPDMIKQELAKIE